MNKTKFVFIFLILTFSNAAFAVDYECIVNKKVDSEVDYSAQQISDANFRVKISDKSEGVVLSRCSYSIIEQKDTCDEYPVSKIVYYKNVKIKKFYVFWSQFDVQLFPNMTFIENNGRGSIAYGKCTVISL
jgi:hypothetical protein